MAVIASAADLPAPELYLVCGLARDPDREALREVVRLAACGLARDPDRETLRDVVRLAVERFAALRRVGARLDVFVWEARAKRF